MRLGLAVVLACGSADDARRRPARPMRQQDVDRWRARTQPRRFYSSGAASKMVPRQDGRDRIAQTPNEEADAAAAEAATLRAEMAAPQTPNEEADAAAAEAATLRAEMAAPQERLARATARERAARAKQEKQDVHPSGAAQERGQAVNATACAPVPVVFERSGFGNAFDVLFAAYVWARSCGARVGVVSSETNRVRRICDRLTCAGATGLAPAAGADPSYVFTGGAPRACPPGCRGKPPRGKQLHWSRAPVAAASFVPTRGGAWLVALACVGPNATARAAAGVSAARPFATAAHIRSARFDFERPPAAVARDRPQRLRREGYFNESLPTNAHPRYDADGWAHLARRIHGLGDVFIASDNAPARDELARLVAARNGTACYVPRTPGHSSYATSRANDDHALTDWWALAHARTIYMVGLGCWGPTANSCQFKRACEPHCRQSSFSGSAHKLHQRTAYRSLCRTCPK